MIKHLMGGICILFLAAATCGAQTPAGEWTDLFDGKSLDGWKASEKPGSFKAEAGQIVACGPKSHLFFTGTPTQPADFKNFELVAELRTTPGTNSGIYFHTAFQDKDFPKKGLEVQINNTERPQEAGYIEHKMTGSLYGLRNVYKPVVADGEWFKMRIEVRSKHVRTWVNDTLLVDFVEPSNAEVISDPKRNRQLGHGTVALQCHDANGKAEFKSIRLRRLPDSEATDVIPGKYDELDKQIVELNRGNFPLVDFHIHLKGGLTLEEALARSRRLGINYGIAFNCGLNFPITDDAGIEAVLKTVKGAPCYIGMQAEGREWVKMFSKEAIAKFDYVFTDGMTLANLNGKRARLWIKDEYQIGDKQAFMELLVKSIVGILDNEPVDIYANPLFIPEELQAEFDQLWTPERLQAVLDALKRNGVALELSNRYAFLKPEFIKKAQALGIKFTIGTNNGDGNFGRDELALKLVKECGLTWKDMWTPKPDGQKPVQVKGKK